MTQEQSGNIENLVYRVDSSQVTAEALLALYTAVGWNADGLRSIESCSKILQNSWCHVSVHDGEDLIGFARVLADGFLGEILDVIVLSQYRRQGIATELMRRIMDMASHELTAMCLVDGSGLLRFYERFGFETADPKENVLMYWQRGLDPGT